VNRARDRALVFEGAEGMGKGRRPGFAAWAGARRETARLAAESAVRAWSVEHQRGAVLAEEASAGQHLVTGDAEVGPDAANAAVVSWSEPTESLDFDYDAAYAVYNWELFHHLPMLAVERLAKARREQGRGEPRAAGGARAQGGPLRRSMKA
jgi:hypothetical protein